MAEIYTCEKCGIRYYHPDATHENFHGIIYEKDGINIFSCQVENCPDKLKTLEVIVPVTNHILIHDYDKNIKDTENIIKCTECDSYFEKDSNSLSNHYTAHIPIEFLPPNSRRGKREFFDYDYFKHENNNGPKNAYQFKIDRKNNKKHKYYRPIIKKTESKEIPNYEEMEELKRKMLINRESKEIYDRELKKIDEDRELKKRKLGTEGATSSNRKKNRFSERQTYENISAPAPSLEPAPILELAPEPTLELAPSLFVPDNNNFKDRYKDLNSTRSNTNCMQLAFSILLDIKNNFSTNPTLHEKNDESYGSLHPNVNEEGVIESSYSVDNNFSNFIKPLVFIDLTKETYEETRFFLKKSNFENIDKILKDFPKNEYGKSYGIVIYTPKNFIENWKAKKPVPLAHVVPWYSDEHSLFYIDAQPKPVACYENHFAPDDYFNKNYISEVFYLVLSISKDEKKNAEMLKKIKIEPKGDGLLKFKVTKKSKKRSNISKRKFSKKKSKRKSLKRKSLKSKSLKRKSLKRKSLNM